MKKREKLKFKTKRSQKYTKIVNYDIVPTIYLYCLTL